MAKQNKSGLGRGLNSLLSGSMEEAIPAEAVPSKQRTMVTVDEELPTPAPTQKPAQKPTPAKQPLSERQIVKESEPVAEKVQDTAAPEKSQPYLEEEDHVTIKSVVAREVKDKRVDEVELTSIEPNPDQPRTNFKQEEIEELASSIEKDGLLQPILVRSMANGK